MFKNEMRSQLFEQSDDAIPPEWLSHHGEYIINKAYKKRFIVIQHDPKIKVELTELFRDNGNTILQTDLNYTGMIWKSENVMGLLNITANPDIQCVFIPFKMRKWAQCITSSFIITSGLYQDALYNNYYLDAIVTCFKDRELFGHLDLHCMRIGVRVHCFFGDATWQTNKIKKDICWVLQFEAVRNRLCWHVNHFSQEESCDITIIVTVSAKCYMTGIQIRRPRPQIPASICIEGLCLMWPFLQASETLRVLDYYRGDQFQSICMLTFGEAVAAFLQVKKKFLPTDETAEQICWVPLRWEMLRVHELQDRIIPSETNRELTADLMVIRKCVRTIICVNSHIDEDYYYPVWFS